MTNTPAQTDSLCTKSLQWGKMLRTDIEVEILFPVLNDSQDLQYVQFLIQKSFKYLTSHMLFCLNFCSIWAPAPPPTRPPLLPWMLWMCASSTCQTTSASTPPETLSHRPICVSLPPPCMCVFHILSYRIPDILLSLRCFVTVPVEHLVDRLLYSQTDVYRRLSCRRDGACAGSRALLF